MKLVLIHGRDQQGKDPKKLLDIWMRTLEKGLAKNNLKLPSNVDIVFPFYGDELDKLVKGAQIPGPEIISRGQTGDEEKEFYNDFLSELAKNAAVSNEKILLHIQGAQELGPLNWGWIQAILKVLDNTPVGKLSLTKFTYDVYIYLTKSGISKYINKFVTNEIGESHCVVVGHSLGSVVGYNVLCNLNKNQVSKYITVGSPLGLRSIQAHLEKPLCMPKSLVNGWYNAFDNGDVVALNPLDTTFFPILPAIINNENVDNHTDNQHGIEGYLNNAEVALEIYRSLLQ